MRKIRSFSALPALLLLLTLAVYAPRADAANTGDNGIEVAQSVRQTGDGTFTIQLEAYTTGTVTTTTSTQPVDFVLVLDQSASMGDDDRQSAMKSAAAGFIASVNGTYDAETSDHRIAIVTYNGSASVDTNWTYADDTGINTLTTNVNDLPQTPSGAGNIGAAMEQAETLMGSDYAYTGSNAVRQKVVIVFTAGVPSASGTAFDTGVADTAIVASKRMKDAGITVYSIGIFDGANNGQLYGNTNSSGTAGNINYTWADLDEVFGYGGWSKAAVAAGNRFLNYLSSNSENAATLGLQRDTYIKTVWFIITIDVTYERFKITANYDCNTSAGYYLTASDVSKLSNIFQSITSNIETTTTQLDGGSVLKTVVADAFQVGTVRLYTAAHTKNGTFNAATGAPTAVTKSIDGNTVSVTGFNYSANFVTRTKKSDGTYGKKLIVEIDITRKAGFLGGNNVPVSAEAGVYAPDGSRAASFPASRVNLSIGTVTVSGSDRNVYLLSDLTRQDLSAGLTAQVDSLSLEFSPTADNYGLSAWQNAYVDITAAYTNAAGQALSEPVKPTDDMTCTATVTVSPKTDGAGATGTAATAKSGSSSIGLKVFKPELSYKDGQVYYGESVPADLSALLTGTRWLHDGTEDSAVTMTGAKPALTRTYTPKASALSGGLVNGKTDIPVAVSVKIGDQNITAHTDFVHTDCSGGTCTLPAGNHLLLHVKTCSLTVTKTGGKAGEPYVFTVYKGGQPYTQATIVGNGSVTLYELPVGRYSIAEDTAWSWRYTADNGSAVTLNPNNPGGTITCTNTSANEHWLGGFSALVQNVRSAS